MGFIVSELSFEVTSIKMALEGLPDSVAFRHDYAAFKQWRTAGGWDTEFPFYRWVQSDRVMYLYEYLVAPVVVE